MTAQAQSGRSKRKSSVVKRAYSIPTSLFNFAKAQAKAIAKKRGLSERPNLSNYITSLIFQDKVAHSQNKQTVAMAAAVLGDGAKTL